MFEPRTPFRTAPRSSERRRGIPAAVVLSLISLSGTVGAQPTTKTFVDYVRPTPITCSPLSSATWGAAGVLPRDTCNGIESIKGAAVPPEYYYWDGKILRAKDGTFHLFGSSWLGSKGFGQWYSSDAFHATSSQGVLGPYLRQGYAYSNGPDSGDRSKGHNVSACELPDGTYCLIVSEIVPFTIFTATSLDGPWTNRGHASIDRNGVPLSIPFPGDQNLESNVSLVVRHDGNFEIVQRHGIIAISTTGLLGPYKVQQPTNTYSAAEAVPSTLASIFPNRKKHLSSGAPQTPESTYVLAEDPVIWYSGGQYHVVYNYPGDRVAYHLTSPDGVHDWTDRGLAYDPRLAQKLFSYVGNTTLNQWFKMERPGVVMQDGHITHVTWAVSDVDKNDQIPANSNHGSKIIVVPFDGVAFDADTGVAGNGGTGGGGTSSTGGASGRGGSKATGGASATGGANAAGGTIASTNAIGGATGNTGGYGAGGKPSSGGALATGGASHADGSTDRTPTTQAAANPDDTSDPEGCSCRVGGKPVPMKPLVFAGVFGIALLRMLRRRPNRLRTH